MQIPRATSVLFIGGRSGVGKSSAAYDLSRQFVHLEISHVLIDGDNLDHAFPVPDGGGTPMALRNLAAMWANYAEAGYHRLVYTNTVSVMEMEAIAAALGGAVEGIGALLLASDATAAARLGGRETGAALKEHVERSRRADAYLRGAAPASVHRVGTDGLTPEDVAAELLALTGWVAV